MEKRINSKVSRDSTKNYKVNPRGSYEGIISDQQQFSLEFHKSSEDNTKESMELIPENSVKNIKAFVHRERLRTSLRQSHLNKEYKKSF